VITGERAAALLWQGIIPLVPFVLLLNVRIWRNACPLGRLSQGPEGAPAGIGRAAIRTAILIFAAILPFRATWFAESGVITAGFLGAIGVVAVSLGRRSARRSGFCTTFCPMLPVELLYGQAPLVEVGRGACSSCSLCTARACPQLSPRAAIAQHLGRARQDGTWTLTPMGAFAAAFPGVIVAFSLSSHPSVAASALDLMLGATVSWGAASAVIAVLRPRWDRAMLSLGWMAIALWAWLTMPGVADVWGWPQATPLLRASTEMLALVWLLHGLRSERRARAATRAQQHSRRGTHRDTQPLHQVEPPLE